MSFSLGIEEPVLLPNIFSNSFKASCEFTFLLSTGTNCSKSKALLVNSTKSIFHYHHKILLSE